LYIPFFAAVALVWRGSCHLKAILTASFLVRLVLLPGYPMLETDLYRYLWDGRMTGIGQNPYEFSPLEVEQGLSGDPEHPHLEHVVEEIRSDDLYLEILTHINNKKVPTIYLPVAQGCFAVADRCISGFLPHSSLDPEEDWSRRAQQAMVIWKGLLLFFEMGILWLIPGLLIRAGRAPEWVVVYGWCPLVLKEYVNTGHYDPVVVFFVLLAFRFLHGVGISVPPVPGGAPREETEVSPPGGIWRRAAAGASLALAIGGKLYPLVFLPLMWKWLRWPGLVTAGLGSVLLFAPFAGVGIKLFTGLATYSDRWEFNSSLVAFLERVIAGIQDLLRGAPLPPQETGAAAAPLFSFAGADFDLDAFFGAKLLCVCLVAGSLLFLMYRQGRTPHLQAEGEQGPVSFEALLYSCYFILGVLLLASPVTNPWYVSWIVPFLCFFPNPAWLFLTFSQQAYYFYFWNGWEYVTLGRLPWLGIDSSWEIARPLEYLPFYALLLWGWWRKTKSRKVTPSA
jgi:hypothetical protein